MAGVRCQLDTQGAVVYDTVVPVVPSATLANNREGSMTTSNFSLPAVPLHVLLLAMLSVGSACGDDSDGNGNGNLCSTTVSKLRECNLLSAGQSPCENEDGDPAMRQCMVRCTQGAACAQIKDAYCEDSTDNAFVLCMRSCVPTFACNDGSTIPETFRCDGSPDCEGDANEDELGCPAYTCSNGQAIPETWRCDEEPDCDDASDEAGCPAEATFSCADGTSVPASFRCDSEPDCDDGTDELGCPEYATLTCQ